MRRLAPVALVLLGPALWNGGCTTTAKGVDDCREIERARCAAAGACDVGIDTKADQEACERFARDNCLHGLAAPVPRRSELDSCLAAIAAAGDCSGKGVKTLAATCKIPTTDPQTTACQVVEDPELATACTFLLKEPPPEPVPVAKDAGGD